MPCAIVSNGGDGGGGGGEQQYTNIMPLLVVPDKVDSNDLCKELHSKINQSDGLIHIVSITDEGMTRVYIPGSWLTKVVYYKNSNMQRRIQAANYAKLMNLLKPPWT